MMTLTDKMLRGEAGEGFYLYEILQQAHSSMGKEPTAVAASG